MLHRMTCARLGSILTAGLLVAGCGGGGGASQTQSGLNTLAGERLGAKVVEDVGAGGEVVLVHLSRNPEEAAQWVKGLEQALGKGSIVELGPEELPPEIGGVMGGFPPLRYALQQHPNATAIVSALPVGSYEKPSFPASHPPIYALCWEYLPDSVYLFRGKKLAAGIFSQPILDPSRDLDPSQSPETLFDRNYVLATPENLRELVNKY